MLVLIRVLMICTNMFVRLILVHGTLAVQSFAADHADKPFEGGSNRLSDELHAPAEFEICGFVFSIFQHGRVLMFVRTYTNRLLFYGFQNDRGPPGQTAYHFLYVLLACSSRLSHDSTIQFTYAYEYADTAVNVLIIFIA